MEMQTSEFENKKINKKKLDDAYAKNWVQPNEVGISPV